VWASTLRLRPGLAAVLAVVSVVVVFGTGAAHAHGAFGSTKSLWSGPWHLITSPLSVAALIALACALPGTSDRSTTLYAVAAGLLAMAATSLAEHMLPPAYSAPAMVVLVGLVAVSGKRQGAWVGLILACLTGMAAGLAAELDTPVSSQAVSGLGIATAFFVYISLLTLDELTEQPRLKAVMPLARRIVGSWAVAISLLLVALSVLVSKP
jgi:hypothetical protein